MKEDNKSGIERISKPIGYSESTGMNIYQSYTASSGFNYMVGMREIHDIVIVEQIAEGTACTLLCGILIYHKKTKELLKEIEVGRNIRYTRAKTMDLVRQFLIQTLLETCNKNNVEIDKEYTKNYVDKILDECYFSNSQKAILEWAESVGIITLN